MWGERFEVAKNKFGVGFISSSCEQSNKEWLYSIDMDLEHKLYFWLHNMSNQPKTLFSSIERLREHVQGWCQILLTLRADAQYCFKSFIWCVISENLLKITVTVANIWEASSSSFSIFMWCQWTIILCVSLVSIYK